MRLYGPSGDSVCFVVEPEGGAFTANRSQLPGTSLPPVASCSRPAQTSTVIVFGFGKKAKDEAVAAKSTATPVAVVEPQGTVSSAGRCTA